MGKEQASERLSFWRVKSLRAVAQIHTMHGRYKIMLGTRKRITLRDRRSEAPT